MPSATRLHPPRYDDTSCSNYLELDISSAGRDFGASRSTNSKLWQPAERLVCAKTRDAHNNVRDPMGSIARTPALRATNWCASGSTPSAIALRREDLAALGLQIESGLRSREGLFAPTGALSRTARRIGRRAART